jgi:hypothetical protein
MLPPVFAIVFCSRTTASLLAELALPWMVWATGLDWHTRIPDRTAHGRPRRHRTCQPSIPPDAPDAPPLFCLFARNGFAPRLVEEAEANRRIRLITPGEMVGTPAALGDAASCSAAGTPRRG